MTTLPSQLSVEELKKFDLPRLSAEDLEKLTSQKLAAIAAKLITMDSPQGPDPNEPVESLLAELDHTAPTGSIICCKLTDCISHERLTVNDVKNILLKKFPDIITRNKGYIDNFYKEGIDGIRLEAIKSAQYLIDYKSYR